MWSTETTKLKLILLLLLVVTLEVACTSPNDVVSDLRPCSQPSCDFLYEWKLFSKLYGSDTYTFQAGNATVDIYNAKWTTGAYLNYLRSYSYPKLVQEHLFVVPAESVCLTEVGVDETISCQNPTNIASVRESGVYCNNPNTLASYQVYSMESITQIWSMELNLTVQVDAGNVTYHFSCESMTQLCRYKGGGSLPEMSQYRYLFDTWLIEFGSSDLLGTFLVVPSPGRLFPYTPFPEDAFLVPYNHLPVPELPPKPDCSRWDGNLAQFNISTEYFPEDIRLGLISDYGVKPESLSLVMKPMQPLYLYFELTRPGPYIWFEAITLIPNRDDARIVP